MNTGPDFLKKELSEFLKPVAHLVYNEIYLYVWFICIYSIFLMTVTLANLFVLLKLWRRTAATYYHASKPLVSTLTTGPC